MEGREEDGAPNAEKSLYISFSKFTGYLISYSKFTGHLILKSLDIVNVLRGDEREEDAAPNSEKSAFTTQQCEAVRFWNLSSTRSSARPP